MEANPCAAGVSSTEDLARPDERSKTEVRAVISRATPLTAGVTRQLASFYSAKGFPLCRRDSLEKYRAHYVPLTNWEGGP